MKNRFQFYEVVTVVGGDDNRLEPVLGKEGTILGMALDEESRRWIYSVSMSPTGEVWNLDEQQLASTGKQRDRSDVYSGDAVKIHVDPKTGKGSLH